jgi:hypothetical protein
LTVGEGGAVLIGVLRGDRLGWEQPGVSGHELVQDFVGAEAVLAGGIDVAADVEAVLSDVVAGEAGFVNLIWPHCSSASGRPEIICWVFRGRTPRSLMLFEGPATRYLLPGEADMPRITNTTLTREKVKT